MNIQQELEMEIGRSVLAMARLSRQAEKWVGTLPNTHECASDNEVIKVRWYQKRVRDEQDRIDRLIAAQLEYEETGTDRLLTILSL